MSTNNAGDSAVKRGDLASYPLTSVDSLMEVRCNPDYWITEPSPTMAYVQHVTRRTAVYGPVRTVVWEGSDRKGRPRKLERHTNPTLKGSHTSR